MYMCHKRQLWALVRGLFLSLFITVFAFAIRQYTGSSTHRYKMDRNIASLGLFEKYLKQRRVFDRRELE